MNDQQTNERIDPTLFGRLQQVLAAGREELFACLQDPDATVLRAALKNPRLGEEHLLALLRRRDLPEDFLKAVGRLKQVESSHRLKVALVYNPGAPGALVQSLLPQLHLFELVNLCYLPGATPDQKVAAERVIIQRLPTTELGHKLTLARRGTSVVVGELLKEGDSRLMDVCLANPRLKEVSILQFLSGVKATADTISCIARHPKWRTRPNLRLAFLKNRKTPPIWYTLFLPGLRSTEINSLLASRRLNPNQKKLVEGELKRRGHGLH